jgi:hypothetical protein
MKLSVVLFTFGVALTTGQLAARAETLQIPEGGKAVPVGKDRVVCGELPEGWVVSGDRHSVRPPESASTANRTVQATIAASPAGCGRESCLAATTVGKIQQCVLPLSRKFPADAVLRWLPRTPRTPCPPTLWLRRAKPGSAYPA